VVAGDVRSCLPQGLLCICHNLRSDSGFLVVKPRDWVPSPSREKARMREKIRIVLFFDPLTLTPSRWDRELLFRKR